MARARNLKPSFFTSEQVASCSPLARLLFAGLWCLADRAGKLRDRPRKIKAELMPYEAAPDAEEWLAELASAGLLLRYEGQDGERYIKITGFEKHQNPHPREPASEIPEPCIYAAGHEKALPGPAPSPSPLPLSPFPQPATDAVAGRLPAIATRVGERLGQPRVGLGDLKRRNELVASVGRVVSIVGEERAVDALVQIAHEHLGGQVSALTAFIGWIDRIPDREWRRAGGAS